MHVVSSSLVANRAMIQLQLAVPLLWDKNKIEELTHVVNKHLFFFFGLGCSLDCVLIKRSPTLSVLCSPQCSLFFVPKVNLQVMQSRIFFKTQKVGKI